MPVADLETVLRAPRFPLHLPGWYRRIGEIEWQPATTADISASGVLFQVDDPLPLNTRLEFRVALTPASAEARHDGELCCVGRVVRVVGTPERDHNGFAVAIEGYDLQPAT